jgi:hypothetical protein
MENYGVLLATFVMSLLVSVGSAIYLMLWITLPNESKKQRGPFYLQMLWIGSKLLMLAVGIASSGRSALLLRGEDFSAEYSLFLRAAVWGVMSISILASVTKLVWDLWSTALTVKLEEMTTFQAFLDNSISRAAKRAALEVSRQQKDIAENDARS